MWVSDHVRESLIRNKISESNNYSQYTQEIVGEASSDILCFCTGEFVYGEVHDIKNAERFVEFTDEHYHENLGFASGNFNHVLTDIKSHNDPIFQRYVDGLARKIIDNGHILDLELAKVIAHLALEFDVGLKHFRKNPEIAEIAHKTIKDVDKYSPLISEFYGKDVEKLREQLSVTRDFKVEFFSDPVCFAKTLLDNYKRIGKVKDERLNSFFDYLKEREDCIEQDINLILSKVDKYLFYNTILSSLHSFRQVRDSPLFNPFKNYKKLQL